jgi:lipid-A-disaccharide synthase
MRKKIKIFIIAGEVSGDVLGSEIINAASKKYEFVGVGGSSMRKAGLKSIFPISDLSVMGFVEVIKKSRTLIGRINQTVDEIIKTNPDIVLTIDSPSFAARVIKKVKRAGVKTKFYHVVAPMVWAWGRKRAEKYAKLFDKLFCFFDFEVPYFTKYKLPTVAIGHPIYYVVNREQRSDDKKYVLMLPGSRMSEVERLLPVYEEFVNLHPELSFAISTTETTKNFITEKVKSWKSKVKLIPFEKRYSAYNQAKFAIAKSGTVVAELAIMHIPTVVVYKANFITTLLSKIVLKTKHVSLVNILADKEIFPELLGSRATVKNIDKAIKIMDMNKVIRELKSVDSLWHKTQNPTKMILKHI